MPEARKREAESGLELDQEPEPKAEPRDKAGAKAGSATGATEAVDCPILKSYHHGLHALLSRLALLSSVSLGPLLLTGLVSNAVFSAVTTRSRLRGHDAGNGKMLKTGIGPTRRLLILGWLAVTSGFSLPEDGVAQIDADVELAYDSTLSSHELTISGEGDGTRDRRRLASGSGCDNSWCADSPPTPLALGFLASPLLPSCSQR